LIFRSLYARLAVTFAAILLCFGAVLGRVSYEAARVHQQEVTQSLSRGLAAHIAAHNGLDSAGDLDHAVLEPLFRMLMAVNPSIEVYLLDRGGVILAHAAPTGVAPNHRVSLAPIKAFLGGSRLPVAGDNPRHPGYQTIFSVAPVGPPGAEKGYLYVVLEGEAHARLSESAGFGYALTAGLWFGAAVLGCALLVGLVLFRVMTRRVNALAAQVEAFSMARAQGGPMPLADQDRPGDEIGRLVDAFTKMAQTISRQMTELKRQDELRRQLVANVSHDLRTPLTAMQNYLENTLALADTLTPGLRRMYLERAVRQSHGVARLARQLFELARLECEEVLPEAERFCMSELMQDIAHKMEFAARDKGVLLDIAQPGEPMCVVADIGMIERVVTNLIDNAIRCTPAGGRVGLETLLRDGRVDVVVSDTGCGIAAEYLPGLFERDSPLRAGGARSNAGLGLLIVKRILTLHGTGIEVDSIPGVGTRFRFALAATDACCAELSRQSDLSMRIP
jgi:signal transduction histidine kinase